MGLKDKLYTFLAGLTLSLASLANPSEVGELEQKIHSIDYNNLNKEDEGYYLNEIKKEDGVEGVEETDQGIIVTPKNDYRFGNEINGRLFGWTSLYQRVLNSKGEDVPVVYINPRLFGEKRTKVIAHEFRHHGYQGREEWRVRKDTNTEEVWKFDNNLSYG
jgi:hypothetical protein